MPSMQKKHNKNNNKKHKMGVGHLTRLIFYQNISIFAVFPNVGKNRLWELILTRINFCKGKSSTKFSPRKNIESTKSAKINPAKTCGVEVQLPLYNGPVSTIGVEVQLPLYNGPVSTISRGRGRMWNASLYHESGML